MDRRRPIIRTIANAESLHAQMVASAARTAEWLRSFAGEPMALLKALRFDTVGHDPLTGEPLNVVEQLNQTFTILVTVRAVEQLIELHSDAGGFRLALGTSSGRDVESVAPDLVAAEIFSATHPNSNQKLKKDLARLDADRPGTAMCSLPRLATEPAGKNSLRMRREFTSMQWSRDVAASRDPPTRRAHDFSRWPSGAGADRRRGRSGRLALH
jgi:hypothetical protein